MHEFIAAVNIISKNMTKWMHGRCGFGGISNDISAIIGYQ